MTDTDRDLRSLRRPRILVRAARFGLSDYVRDRDLGRVLAPDLPPGPGQAMRPLFDREAEMESVRASGSAGYSAARHVEVLVALMAESRLAAAALS